MLFLIRENSHREPEVVAKMLELVEKRDIDGALAVGRKSQDTVARILVYSLTNRDYSLSNAFVRASGQELARSNQGMAVLDNAITAAPLLGLLGTVTGLMRAFLNIGSAELSVSAVTGGIGEALIATACGLGIAIFALVPFNYFSAKVSQLQFDLETAATNVEVMVGGGKAGDTVHLHKPAPPSQATSH